MSGDDADPVLVAAVLDSFVKELRGRYDEAKFGSEDAGPSKSQHAPIIP
jgi:hypothetical protein